VIGPLYKTVVHDASLRFWQMCGPYPFSVSKINQLLSLFVAVLFFLLAAITLDRHYGIGWPPAISPAVIVAATIVAVTVLFGWAARASIGNATQSDGERK
jgi:hypothetical protein